MTNFGADVPTGAPNLTVKEVVDIAVRVLSEVRIALDHIDLGAVQAEMDYYWHVPIEARYDLSSEPRLVSGSIADDISELQVSVSEPSEERVLYHEVEHLEGLLGLLALILRDEGL